MNPGFPVGGPAADPLPVPPSELTVEGEASALQLLRSRGRMRGVVALLGPAFVAAVAYIDPGNFATNFRPAQSSATPSSG